MKTKALIITLLLPLLVVSQTHDNPLQFNGFVDTYHAVRTQSPNDFISSRTRFRGKLHKTFEKSAVFVSFNLNQNSILPNSDGFELLEAYLEHTSEQWSLRAGRQLIIWGAADGMRITDLVSPMDMTEFLARDYDDIRMPVEALKFRYFSGSMQLEVVYVPIFKGFVLPTNPKNPWALPMPQQQGCKTVLLPEEKPDKALKNSEFGSRLAFALPGIDFSLAALHTWNKKPVFTKTLQSDSLFVCPYYHRMTFVGGDVSKPFGQFVIRGEAAFNFGKRFARKRPNAPLHKSNTVNYLVGIDWYAPSEWMLSLQFANESIFKYVNELETERHAPLLTLNMSKTTLSSTLKLTNFLYIDLNNGGFFNRFSADYSLSDQIHLLVGYDHFEGEKGAFGVYKNNSEVWLKAKYSF